MAREADIVVAVMGEKWDMAGEAASRTSLDLPANQQALLDQLEATGKSIVLVVLNGRPNSIGWASRARHMSRAISIRRTRRFVLSATGSASPIPSPF